MAETTTLPSDTQKAGNVWCEACQQSLPAGRAPAHLATKKHQLSLAGAATATATATTTATSEPKARAPRSRTAAAAAAPLDEPAPAEAKARRPARKAASSISGGLIADPENEGYYWCGICKVSLAPSKAEVHVGTARHKGSEKQLLARKMDTK